METRNIKYFKEYYKDLNNGKLAAKISLYTHYSSRKSKKTTSKSHFKVKIKTRNIMHVFLFLI